MSPGSRLLAFLRKDAQWSRHRLATVLVLFVVVPSVFATGTVFFEHTVPESSPVAVTPADGETTRNELEIVRGWLTFASAPRIVPDRGRAYEQLHREEVYAVIEVPHGIAEKEANVTVDVVVHGGVTIFRMPSRAIVSLIGESLDESLPAEIDAERRVIGPEVTLSTYLLPTFGMIVVMLIALVYLPANLAAEAAVFDRVRIDHSLAWLLAAKLLFFAGLASVSVAVVYTTGLVLGYGLGALTPAALGMYMLAFVFLAALGTAIMLATDVGDAGRVLNAVLFFALVPLSNLAYPAGFLSPIGRTVARANPLHYAMIVARSLLLKGHSPVRFADWIAGIALFTAASLLVLGLATIHFERTR